MENKNKSWIWIAVCNYFILFIFLPFFVLELTTETVTICILILWSIVFPFLASQKGVKPVYFFKQMLLFYLLVMLYHPRGIYGIFTGGSLDFSPAWLDALYIIFFISIGQFVVAKITNKFLRFFND